jgi:hypothetical protein
LPHRRQRQILSAPKRNSVSIDALSPVPFIVSPFAPGPPLPLWERASCRELARGQLCASRLAGRVRGDSFFRRRFAAHPSPRAHSRSSSKAVAHRTSRSSSEAVAHQRCLTPPGALRRAALPIKGSDGVRCCVTTRHAFSLPRRWRVRSLRGMARRKAQTYGVAILARTARAPLGAPVAAI